MKHTLFAIAAGSLALVATSAQAQTATPATSFLGFRAEGQVGLDRFQSQGEHNDRFGYGGAIGFDGKIGDKIVVGPEASYWRANDWTSNRTAGVRGGTVDQKSFEELGAAVRVGYLVTPQILVYGKGGYVSNDQRKSFIPAAGTGETGFYNHGRTDGYQVGGGVEYSLTDMFYVNGEYKYSDYADHTARQRALLGFGVRFKPGL